MNLTDSQLKALVAIHNGADVRRMKSITVRALQSRGLVNLKESWGVIKTAEVTTNGKIILQERGLLE